MRKIAYLMIAIVFLGSGIIGRVAKDDVLAEFGIQKPQNCSQLQIVKKANGKTYAQMGFDSPKAKECLAEYRKYAMILTIISGALIGGGIGALITVFKKKKS